MGVGFESREEKSLQRGILACREGVCAGWQSPRGMAWHGCDSSGGEGIGQEGPKWGVT